MKRFAATMLAAFGLLWGQTGAWAQQSGDATQYTQQTFYDWFAKYKDAKPDFKAGDTLTHADLEKVRPFMLPGYFEQFQKWTDLKMEVVETYHVKPHKMVLDCNEKFQKQVKLAADGAEPVGSTPEQFAAFIQSEIDKWSRVVKSSGIHVE